MSSQTRTERLNAIRTLAAWWPDTQPAPKTTTGMIVQRSAVHGPSYGRMGACPTCKGTKRLLGPMESKHPCHRCLNGEPRPHHCRACLNCKGSGRVKYDPFLNEPVEENYKPRAMTRQEAFAAETRAGRLAGNLPPAPETADAALGMAASSAGALVTPSLSRAGSFAELGTALATLHDRDPRLHRAFIVAWVEHREVRTSTQVIRKAEYAYLDSHGQRRGDLALAAVERLMPVPITIPAWIVEGEKVRRDVDLADVFALGWNTKRICREFNLTADAVKHARRRWIQDNTPAAA